MGELLGLQWSDWEWQRGLVVIRWKVKVERRLLLIEDTKTHRIGRLDVADDLLARWRELRSIREAEAAVAGHALSPWCCPSVKAPATRPLNASWFNHKIWERILNEAKLRRLRVHDARHTYAALSLRQGKPLEYISKQLRHSRLDITLRLYGPFKPGVMRHLANNFEARIHAFEERAE